jgi:hypothetical protein
MVSYARHTLRSLILALWAVLLTVLTYVFGAPVLKTARRYVGRPVYWGLFLVISAGFFAMKLHAVGLALLSLVVLIGVFEEFVEMGLTFRLAMFFTLLVNALLSTGAFALWVYYSGPKWSAILRTGIEALLKPVFEMNAHFQLDLNELLLQLPSIVLISWMVSLYLSVLLEKLEVSTLRPQLGTFKAPDVFVWLMIGSLLGTFGNFEAHTLQVISINVLNVCVLLFFFQGIAVVARLLDKLRMGAFWQWAFMVLIVVQLFLLVSVLGLMDYWFDFRGRLERRASSQVNRET